MVCRHWVRHFVSCKNCQWVIPISRSSGCCPALKWNFSNFTYFAQLWLLPCYSWHGQKHKQCPLRAEKSLFCGLYPLLQFGLLFIYNNCISVKDARDRWKSLWSTRWKAVCFPTIPDFRILKGKPENISWEAFSAMTFKSFIGTLLVWTNLSTTLSQKSSHL